MRSIDQDVRGLLESNGDIFTCSAQQHGTVDIDPGGVTFLLRELGEAGASDAVTALAARAANAGMFGRFLAIHPDEASSYLSGREPDRALSQSWKWQEP